MAKHARSNRRGYGRGTAVGVVLVVGIAVVAALMMSNGSSPATRPVVDSTAIAAPPTTVANDETETVLATWDLELGDLIITESLVFSGGTMTVVAVPSDGREWVMEVLERPADKLGERRFDLQPGDVGSEYLVLSLDGTVRYFSWEGRQLAYQRVKFIAADAMTIGLDPVAVACVPKDLSVVSLRIIGLYEQLQAFKDDPEFARVGFATGGPYNHWLTTFDTLEEDVGESLEQLGFVAGDVMMLGMDYVLEDQEGIVYLEKLIKAGIVHATCAEPGSAQREAIFTTTTTIATTTTLVVLPNPGDAVSCADFGTWEEAQTWYDTYAPYYGDIALIDTNNNGVACEKLLPEGMTVEQAAASLTTSTSSATTTVAEP